MGGRREGWDRGRLEHRTQGHGMGTRRLGRGLHAVLRLLHPGKVPTSHKIGHGTRYRYGTNDELPMNLTKLMLPRFLPLSIHTHPRPRSSPDPGGPHLLP